MLVFEVISIVSIAIGGLLAAFTARKPTRFASWVSGYLVLVPGLLQLGIFECWQRLGIATPRIVLVAFIVFNLGNAVVITGRAMKGRSVWSTRLVGVGSIPLIFFVVRLVLSSKISTATATKTELYVLLALVLFGAIAGLALSVKSRVLETSQRQPK